MRLFGATDEDIQKRFDRDNGDFLVHPDNWNAVMVFRSSLTQVRRAAMTGVITGLDYAGVAVAAKAIGVKLKAKVFMKIQIMEIEYINAVNAK